MKNETKSRQNETQHKQQPSGLNTRQTYIKFSLKVNVGCFKVRQQGIHGLSHLVHIV